jgi:type I restriction enzyme S subunit
VTTTTNHHPPPGWALTDLQTVAQVNPSLDKSGYADTLPVSFVPMPAVKAGTGVMDVSVTRPLGQVKKGFTPFQQGDVLFAKITPCMENGKMAVVPPVKNGLGFGSTEFHVLRPYDGVEARYIYYFVSSQTFRRSAERKMTGAVGQRRVPTSYVAEHPIPVAPSPEQRRIVEKLEQLFSELDSGIGNLNTAISQLDAYRQALLKAAFQGQLTAEWRRDSQPRSETAQEIRARLAHERQNAWDQQVQEWANAVADWESGGQRGGKPTRPRVPKPVQKLAETESADLPALPKGWLWEKLGWMTCGVDYGTAAKSQKSGAVAVLRMGNLQEAKLDWSDLAYTSNPAEIAAYLLKPGDVLFNRTNSPELVGKTAVYRGEQPAIFAGYLIRVNHIARLVDSQYLSLFLNSPVARVHANTVKTDGVNQSNINGQKLTNYPFPYCSLAEQEELVRILDEKLSLIDEVKQQIERELQRIEALRHSILVSAFSGRLVPQDRADEPAAILLERIRSRNQAAIDGAKKGTGKKRKSAA